MTIRETLRRQRQSEQDRAPDDDEVLTFLQWCASNGFSESTGRRLRKAGKGPIFTQLSDRLLGVTRRNNRDWQAARSLQQSHN